MKIFYFEAVNVKQAINMFKITDNTEIFLKGLYITKNQIGYKPPTIVTEVRCDVESPHNRPLQICVAAMASTKIFMQTF